LGGVNEGFSARIYNFPKGEKKVLANACAFDARSFWWFSGSNAGFRFCAIHLHDILIY